VETDTEAIDIHLGNQRQPIFLLDRPGSHAAGFFAASTEADYLLKMQQLLKGKIEQGKRDRKRLDAELIILDRQLDHFQPLDDLEVHINQAENLYLAILETGRQLPILEEAINLQQQTQVKLHLKEQAAAGLGLLENPPELEDATGLSLLLAELTDTTKQRHLEGARISELTPLTSPPALLPTAALETVLVQIRATQNLYKMNQTKSRLLAPLTPPPETAEVEKLQELLQIFQETLAQHAALRKRQTILLSAAEPPQLEATAALESLILQLDREQNRQERQERATLLLVGLQLPPENAPLRDLENSLDTLKQTVTEVSGQQAYLADLSMHLDHKKVEIQAYLQDTGLCPLCGSPLDLGHFLENRHV
jgi:exonuclease SbcC